MTVRRKVLKLTVGLFVFTVHVLRLLLCRLLFVIASFGSLKGVCFGFCWFLTVGDVVKFAKSFGFLIVCLFIIVIEVLGFCLFQVIISHGLRKVV